LHQKICFVFDNTDQKTDDQQIQILMYAFERARIYEAIIITALRLESYFHSKDKPPLDAYEPIIFRIEPPGVKELLKKRLKASQHYQKEEFIIDLEQKNRTKAIRIPVAKFVRVLENTLDYIPDQQVAELFEYLSGGNMRRTLQIFQRFIQAGSTVLYQNIELMSNLKGAIKIQPSF